VGCSFQQRFAASAGGVGISQKHHEKASGVSHSARQQLKHKQQQQTPATKKAAAAVSPSQSAPTQNRTNHNTLGARRAGQDGSAKHTATLARNDDDEVTPSPLPRGESAASDKNHPASQSPPLCATTNQFRAAGLDSGLPMFEILESTTTYMFYAVRPRSSSFEVHFPLLCFSLYCFVG